MSGRKGFALSSKDGTPLFFEYECLSSDARTIVLCDGLGCDGYVWRYLRPLLSKTHNVLHWHYRGHGRSQAPRDPTAIDISVLASDLLDVMSDCQINEATIVGHSMGVQVALECYRHSPKRIDQMIFMCGSPGRPLADSPVAPMIERFLPILRQSVGKAPGLVNAITKNLLRRKIAYTVATKIELNPELNSEEEFRPYFDGMARMDMEFFLDLLEKLTNHDARDILSEIDIPVLVIGGAKDSFTPISHSSEMANHMAKAELMIVEDGSHTAPLERPELINQRVLEFLSQSECSSGL